jgi:hypothetical protein
VRAVRICRHFHPFQPHPDLGMGTGGKELSDGNILRYIAGSRESNINLPGGAQSTRISSWLDWIRNGFREHLPDIAFCARRSPPGSAKGASPQLVAPWAKSGSASVKFALIILAQFRWSPQYDDRGRPAICNGRSAWLPAGFAIWFRSRAIVNILALRLP